MEVYEKLLEDKFHTMELNLMPGKVCGDAEFDKPNQFVENYR